jgi:hypothetical protein
VFATKWAALFILFIATRLFAWGPEGHRVIAQIARAHLSQAARLQVRELLGNDDLASVSTWADEIRPQRPETFGWHFVDIPMKSSGFDEQRDCYRRDERFSRDDHHNCVVDRIVTFKQVLGDKNATRPDRVEALKFLVHFVGDIHQPMHAIAEARGGNDIQVIQFGSSKCGIRPCNLHSAWDFGLIEHAARSNEQYAADLEQLIARQHLKPDGTPASWANESFQIAKEVWLNEAGTIDELYFRRNIGSIDERLALAGVRLAKLLNDCLR